MLLSRTLGAGAVLTTAFALATTPASARDYADTALNIVPSGQFGAVPLPSGADTQAKMYDGLTPLFDKVSDADLRRFFKSEALNRPGVDGPARTRRLPRRGVTITRDKYNVPFVKATSQSGARVGRRLGDRPGPRAAARAGPLQRPRRRDRRSRAWTRCRSSPRCARSSRAARPSASSPSRRASCARTARAAAGCCATSTPTSAGINAQLRASKSKVKPWTRNDVYALNALKGEFLGQGGGDEARRSQLLDGLSDRLGAGPGKAVYDDLRNLDDPESSATTSKRFVFAAKPGNTSGNVVLDNGSYKPTPAATLAAAPAPRRRPTAARRTRATSSWSRATARPPASRCSSAARRSATSTPA